MSIHIEQQLMRVNKGQQSITKQQQNSRNTMSIMIPSIAINIEGFFFLLPYFEVLDAFIFIYANVYFELRNTKTNNLFYRKRNKNFKKLFYS